MSEYLEERRDRLAKDISDIETLLESNKKIGNQRRIDILTYQFSWRTSEGHMDRQIEKTGHRRHGEDVNSSPRVDDIVELRTLPRRSAKGRNYPPRVCDFEGVELSITACGVDEPFELHSRPAGTLRCPIKSAGEKSRTTSYSMNPVAISRS